MTGFPGSPKTSRGALIGIDPENPLASVVIFQYNPDEMTRTLQARAATGAGTSAGARDEALRLTGAPIENITLAVEIDASDQLESGDPLATTRRHLPPAVLVGDAALPEECPGHRQHGARPGRHDRARPGRWRR